MATIPMIPGGVPLRRWFTTPYTDPIAQAGWIGIRSRTYCADALRRAR